MTRGNQPDKLGSRERQIMDIIYRRARITECCAQREPLQFWNTAKRLGPLTWLRRSAIVREWRSRMAAAGPPCDMLRRCHLWQAARSRMFQTVAMISAATPAQITVIAGGP